MYVCSYQLELSYLVLPMSNIIESIFSSKRGRLANFEFAWTLFLRPFSLDFCAVLDVFCVQSTFILCNLRTNKNRLLSGMWIKYLKVGLKITYPFLKVDLDLLIWTGLNKKEVVEELRNLASLLILSVAVVDEVSKS